MHEDKETRHRHTYTACIYPPQDVVGGELVVFDNNKKILATYQMPKDNWLIIVMPIYLKHKSKPVTSGIKYLFKGEGYITHVVWRPFGQIRLREGTCD